MAEFKIGLARGHEREEDKLQFVDKKFSFLTFLHPSLTGEIFRKDESRSDGEQMDTPLKSVSEKPLKNSTEEQEITALEHKCAQYISDELSTGLENKMGAQMDGNTRLCMFFAKTSLFDFRIFYFLERCHRYCRG